MRSERRLRRLRDWLLRQRMRQRLKRSVVLERQMRSFVRFNKGEDRYRVIARDMARSISRRSLPQREPMRIRKAARVPMPRAKRRQVVAFSGHSEKKRKEKKRQDKKRKEKT